MMFHYPDLCSASDYQWSCHKRNLLQPIRGTTQIWVMTGLQSYLRHDFSGNQLLLVVKCWLFSQASPEAKAYNFIACVASISVRFRGKERGTRVKDRVKNGEKWLSFHFSRGQNRKSRSSGFFAQKLNGNTCYTG